MNLFLAAFVSLALILGVFAFVGLSPAQQKWRRIALSAGFAAVLAGLFFGYSDMLGRPKPSRLELVRGPHEVLVVGDYIVQGIAIYLWIKLPGLKEPRSYVFPYSTKLANDLEKAKEENQQSHGTGLTANDLFESSLETREQIFHPIPQPMMPDKTLPTPPTRFSAPETP